MRSLCRQLPLMAAAAVLASSTLVSSTLVSSTAQAQGHDGHHVMLLADEMKWAAGPASLPPGAQVVMLEGNPAKAEPLTMRLRCPAGYRIAPHTHPAIEHVTVLSGTFHMGSGDRFDEAKGKRLPAGSFVVMPTNAPHFAWASEETVIQLHSVGPWGVTYLDPADDPRRK